ncbi:hypothetical protein SAMN05443575_2159 [Jatrophihabitans endophyticus]|uniref:Uncharacterized protein n=1 Tax=Jatrophihabitans endophyticus TaxID=1206085 RepID=A0A1M5KH85_9ACTN|nr:hypothetical protein [Jatrophihabitans endophyticus]SHG52294.1 hypothetical protein SAMN05443575_2159 [Jatrophihabitans endophyticus]
MKLSNLVYAAIGYTLGARAGRDRYESIVRAARRVSGSQTVQATAGVVQANVDQRVQRAKEAVATRLGGPPARSSHRARP